MEKITINKRHTASFDVDSQTGFTPLQPEQLPIPDGDKIVDGLNEQANYAKIRIMSKDAHPPKPLWLATEDKPQLTPIKGEKNLDLHWNMHCPLGLPGFELLPGLPNPSEYDFLIYKGLENNMHPYTACYHDLEKKISTGVIEFLNWNLINTVIVGGLALDFCAGETAIDLLNAGFRVIINLSATRALNPDFKLEEMRKNGIKIIQNCQELLIQKK
jgi:nicotinamidase/pyrazinamidase